LLIDDGVWFGTGISYVRFGEQGEQLVVRLAYTGSPAKAAGIERGWLATSGSGDCNAANRRVTNTFRDSQGQEHKTELPCEVLHGSGDPEVAVSRMLNPTTFYVWFPGFNKTTASWFEKQVTEHSSASALVIDLRGNSGGAIEALEKCLKLLFPQKIEYAKFYGRNGKEHKLKTGGGNAYSGQVFVLTNRDTGSASEIFSAIIQETKRGVVVGRTTRGGVLGADHFNLPNGFRLHVPLYNLYTPKGIRLEGRGVIPDERVTMTLQDYQSNKDPDVDRVLAILAARP
jgi:carboxyl-terminal processing protease